MELGKNKTAQRDILDPDNPTPEMFYHCQQYYRKVLNPIIDWTTDEVWEFIKEYKVRYCCLYDEGFTRLGCIGCPMGTVAQRMWEFKRYPKYKENYIRAFQKMIDNNLKKGIEQVTPTGEQEMEWRLTGELPQKEMNHFSNSGRGEDVFQWWIK